MGHDRKVSSHHPQRDRVTQSSWEGCTHLLEVGLLLSKVDLLLLLGVGGRAREARLRRVMARHGDDPVKGSEQSRTRLSIACGVRSVQLR